MNFKKNIIKNLFASFFGKFSNTLIRLLQVPLLIYFLGVEDFGRWTVLYTIPSWLALANIGFGTVAANQMTIYLAEKHVEKVNKVYSSTFALLFIILILGIISTFTFVSFIDWESFLKSHSPGSRENEFEYAVIFMAITIFITFFYGLIDGTFRASRKAHVSIYLASFIPWLNLLALFIVLKYSTRFDLLSLGMLLANIVFLIIYFIISKKVSPEIKFSFKYIDIKEFKNLFKKGFAFQAFPLGNALTIQGNIFIIQILLGPTYVALFSTVKTIVNIVKQGIDIINQSSWPELSHLIGKKDFQSAMKIHRYGITASIILSIFGVLFLLFFGEILYVKWTGNNIVLPKRLFLLMLIPIPLNALWNTSSVVHLASNLHEKLAVRYLLYSSITFVATYFLTYFFGIEGTAISIVVLELLLIPYVVKTSIQITQDSWLGFKNDVFLIAINTPKILITKVKLVLKI
ncbi:lipopolysaccharide biosynthesis protein [Mariniflexile sp.]|uniref:lipopolysaccharide biosynthesis protein n=1 Tax=Mariniflexile sp. TaxID=1979402 RepID=UPI0035686E32